MKKTNYFTFLLLFSLSIFFISCSGENKDESANTENSEEKEENKQTEGDNPEETKSEEKLAEFSNDIFSINYPTNWKKMENVQNIPVVFVSPNDGDKFNENASAMYEEISGMDLEKYAKVTYENIAKSDKSTKLIEETEGSDENGKYRTITYTNTSSGIELQYYQRFYIKGETAYILTFATTSEASAKYLTTMTNIFNSFVIK